MFLKRSVWDGRKVAGILEDRQRTLSINLDEAGGGVEAGLRGAELCRFFGATKGDVGGARDGAKEGRLIFGQVDGLYGFWLILLHI